MKIHLISHTNEPLKAIAAAQLNIGTGRNITSINDISKEEAEETVADLLKSFLNSPLEFATINLFWENVPIFILRELIRHRIGWSYAERSLRFYDVADTDIDETTNMDYFPSLDDSVADEGAAISTEDLWRNTIDQQLDTYKWLKDHGASAQDARTVVGVWFPTNLQTACSFRALRDMMALRLSSQAHPAWKDAAKQIKAIVTGIDPFLGDALTDICDIQGRCVWQSRLDRPCDSCAERGRDANHGHDYSNGGQCSCGESV
jgi:thymidylate synthase (FAD)